MSVDAYFLPTAHRRHPDRFCLHHAPAAPARGAVVHVHAWCEEMNKSRRMVAMQSRALAAAGFAVLQIDLLGCGDSAGDFGDATWDDWLDDVAAAQRWMRERYEAPMWLWGLRAGCLLAAQAATRDDERCNFLFWQPVTAGKTHLQQFLRLKAAAALMDGQNKGVVDALKRDLAQGRSVDIAGYTMNAALASGLESARLSPPRAGGRLVWLEVSTRVDATPSAATETALQAWRDGGFDVHHSHVEGPMFWQTTEIEDAAALVAASADAMRAVRCEAAS